METFSALLALCAGNSPVSGEVPAQMPVTRSFDVFFDLCLNKRLRKQSWDWWFETLSSPLGRHSNGSIINNFNKFRSRQYGRHFGGYILKCVFVIESYCILNKIYVGFNLSVQLVALF